MKKIVIIVLIVAAVAAIALFWDKIKAALGTAAIPNGIPGTSGYGGNQVGATNITGGKNGFTAPSLDDTLLLKNGSRGAEVKELQTLLNMVDASNQITADGIFGPQTELELYNMAGVYQITLHDAWLNFAANSGLSLAYGGSKLAPGTPMVYPISNSSASDAFSLSNILGNNY